MESAVVLPVRGSLEIRRNARHFSRACAKTTRELRGCGALKTHSVSNVCRVSTESADSESFLVSRASLNPAVSQPSRNKIDIRRIWQHNELAAHRSRPVRGTGRVVPGATTARTAAPGPGFVSFKSGPGFAQFSSPKPGSSSESVLSPTSEASAESRIRLPLEWARRTFQSVSVPSFPLGNPPEAPLSLKSFSWLLAPILLVLSIHLPPFYLSTILNDAFGGTNVDVFLGLLLTDLSYLVGAAVFVALAFQQGAHLLSPPGTRPWVRLATPLLPPPPGVIQWLQFVWVVGFLLPLATVAVCTPFGTGPMAAAVLIPYFVLLLAEYAAETWPKMVLSPLWPIIAILFQGYRVFQLNRGFTMILDLLRSLPSTPEPTASVAAAASTLSWLLTVLHSLLMLWTTNLGALLCLLPCFYAGWGRGEQVPAPV